MADTPKYLQQFVAMGISGLTTRVFNMNLDASMLTEPFVLEGKGETRTNSKGIEEYIISDPITGWFCSIRVDDPRADDLATLSNGRVIAGFKPFKQHTFDEYAKLMGK